MTAASAWAGAIGLTTGAIGLGAALNQRLPFESPVAAGVALALIVAAPTSVLALLASRRDLRTGPAALTVGMLLVAWIVVQVLFLRAFSFFQPVFFAVGVWLALEGRALIRSAGESRVAAEPAPARRGS